MIAFTVVGIPVPQGSKRVVPTGAGPRLIETNEKRMRPWRSSVAFEAMQAMAGQVLFTGPVELGVQFTFPRPKSHFGTGRNAEVLKDSAPHYVQTKPDLDKLVRAIGDALTGVAFRDDSQIAILDVEKVYGAQGLAQIEVRPLAVLVEAEAA